MPFQPQHIPPAAVEAMNSSRRLRDTREPLRRVFRDDESYGATLFFAAAQTLGLEALSNYAPLTIRLELQDALGIPWIAQDVLDRLMAAIAVATTDLFYTSLPAFIEICNLLSGTPADPELFDPADAFECVWGVAESAIIDPDDDQQASLSAGERQSRFSEEIRAYMGMALAESGFLAPPAILWDAIMPHDVGGPEGDLMADAALLPAALGGNRRQHDDVDELLERNTQELAEQLRPLLALANQPLEEGSANRQELEERVTAGILDQPDD